MSLKTFLSFNLYWPYRSAVTKTGTVHDHPLTFITVFALVFFSFSPSVSAPEKPQASYWLWAGLTERDLSESADGIIYIYQGVIDGRENHARYVHKGIYAYPIKHPNIQIVFRLTSLTDPQKVTSIYLDAVDAWKKYGVSIQGLQLDYDCPTSKLNDYGDYLKRLRLLIPRASRLSVTGLGDWLIKGDARSLKRITSSTDDITFQIYQGRRTLINGIDYIDALKTADFPFRLGLLFHDKKQDWLEKVQQNPYYHGVVYFMQK